MTSPGPSRRGFLKTSTTIVAGAAAAQQSSIPTLEGAPAKILNHHPRMGYRKLGKTGFMISEISLGGHGGSSVEDRVAVLNKAVELGINYVDNNIDTECELYGAAMARCKQAGRDRWFIGFASWPEKVTEEYEKELTPEGMMKNIEARLRSYRTDMLDMWRPVGATWGPGQNRINSLLMVSPKALDMVVQVFEKARQQGKVRYLGISAHNPKVFRRVLDNYPQFAVIIFPYLFLTRELGGDSLLELAQEGCGSDRAQTLRRGHDVRHQAAADHRQGRLEGPRTPAGNAPGAANLRRDPWGQHPRAAAGKRQGLVRTRPSPNHGRRGDPRTMPAKLSGPPDTGVSMAAHLGNRLIVRTLLALAVLATGLGLPEIDVSRLSTASTPPTSSSQPPGDSDATDVLGANAACLVCHLTFVKETLARSHQLKGVSCTSATVQVSLTSTTSTLVRPGPISRFLASRWIRLATSVTMGTTSPQPR